MKKILVSIATAIMLICSMTTTVMAETFQMNMNKDRIGAGETVMVTINLQEALEGSFGNIQGQLYYDGELFDYRSHQLQGGYEDYMAEDLTERGFFTFSYTDFTSEGFSTINQGDIITVEFQAKETLSAEKLETRFVLVMDIQDTKGNLREEKTETSVLIFKPGTSSAAEEDTTDEIKDEEPEMPESNPDAAKETEMDNDNEVSKESKPLKKKNHGFIFALAVLFGYGVYRGIRGNKE